MLPDFVVFLDSAFATGIAGLPSERNLGLWAALSATALWAVTVTVITLASQRVGAQVVNGSRLVLAFLLLMGLETWVQGFPWPLGLSHASLVWLLLSGVVGFSISDGLGIEAFLRIGARMGMLIQTSSPVFSALLAWMFLGQKLSLLRILAMGVTLGGLAMVISERGEVKGHRTSLSWMGIILSLGAGLGNALGQLFSLKGMEGGVPVLGASVVRLAGGALGSLVWLLARGHLKDLERPFRDRRALRLILMGTILGPAVGALLALYAVSHAPLGVAATLLVMTPVFLLPLSHLIFKERISLRSLAGTLVTVSGAALLFWF